MTDSVFWANVTGFCAGVLGLIAAREGFRELNTAQQALDEHDRRGRPPDQRTEAAS